MTSMCNGCAVGGARHRDAADTDLIDTRIRPWVDKQIAEFVGGPEPSLVKFICDKVADRSKPAAILTEMVGVLDDEVGSHAAPLVRGLSLAVPVCKYE